MRIKRFGDGKEPTCVDKTPKDGSACKGDNKPRTYAGLCGLLGSTTYPTGLKKVGDCGPAPPKPQQQCQWIDNKADCNECPDCKFCPAPWKMCFNKTSLPTSCKFVLDS